MNDQERAELEELRRRVGGQPSQQAPQPAPMAAPAYAPQAPVYSNPVQGWPMQAAPMSMGFGQPGPIPQAIGLIVAITVPTPEGEATAHLMFGPEVAQNPTNIQATIVSMLQQGWPVKVYRGGGGGGFGRGNGYGGGGYGGGYGRGGGWRR